MFAHLHAARSRRSAISFKVIVIIAVLSSNLSLSQFEFPSVAADTRSICWISNIVGGKRGKFTLIVGKIAD